MYVCHATCSWHDPRQWQQCITCPAAPCWLTHCKRSCTATAPWVRSARHHVRCSPSLGSLVCCDRCRNSSVYVCKGSMPAVQSRCLVRSHRWAIGQNSAAVPAAASYTAECTGAIMKAAACRPAVPVLGLQEVAGQQKGALRVRTQQPYATWTCAHCVGGTGHARLLAICMLPKTEVTAQVYQPQR